MAMTSEHRGAASRDLRTVIGAGAIGMLSDGRLLERFVAGRGDDDSASAFAELVRRHGPMVLGVCRGVLGHEHDAEDAAQATFLVLARRAGSIRRAESLASWLFGAALKVSARSREQSARWRALEQRGAEMKARADSEDGPPSSVSEFHEELEPAARVAAGADRAVPPGGPDARAGGGATGPAVAHGPAPAGAGPRAAAATAGETSAWRRRSVRSSRPPRKPGSRRPSGPPRAWPPAGRSARSPRPPWPRWWMGRWP